MLKFVKLPFVLGRIMCKKLLRILSRLYPLGDNISKKQLTLFNWLYAILIFIFIFLFEKNSILILKTFIILRVLVLPIDFKVHLRDSITDPTSTFLCVAMFVLIILLLVM